MIGEREREQEKLKKYCLQEGFTILETLKMDDDFEKKGVLIMINIKELAKENKCSVEEIRRGFEFYKKEKNYLDENELIEYFVQDLDDGALTLNIDSVDGKEHTFWWYLDHSTENGKEWAYTLDGKRVYVSSNKEGYKLSFKG